MKQPTLYIIAGPNGAGKTTASLTLLPEMLECSEFVNADEIARGLSPLNPDSVRIRAGRLFLRRIKKLLSTNETFAFETTLSTRSFVPFIHAAKDRNYHIVLLFFWLYSEEMAIERVKYRVSEGGHNIPLADIRRRYKRGIKNLVNLYSHRVDRWAIFDYSTSSPEMIVKGSGENVEVKDEFIYNQIIAYAEKAK